MSAVHRRMLLGMIAGAGLAGSARAESVTLPFENGERPLVAYPQKRKLIRLTSRPPQLETPLSVFNESLITPNDAFFVRYHLAGVPYDKIDPDTFAVQIKGHVEKPVSLSLKQIKAMPSVELTAVNQCSGNGRGFFAPRVPGGQAGNGLMGNAVWRGVPLKHLLDLAGVKAGAVEVKFQGMDGPVLDATPAFAKSLKIDHARDGEVMLAYAMNGAELPFLNGFPVRLIVPGYFGTYWVKHLNQITVLDTPLQNFWMATAYRVPDNDTASVQPGTAPSATRPISTFAVRSFLTSHLDGAKVAANREIVLRGIAFDSGTGIRNVEISRDNGASWVPALLGEDHGRFAFRPWEARVQLAAGSHQLLVRATSHRGEQQPMQARWNPGGYMRNNVQSTTIIAG